jgi:hypothetical protein
MTVHPWMEKRPSRLKVLGVYSKRAVFRSLNSKPYLSGDLFADNADYVHMPLRFRYNRSWYKDLKSALVIFCPSGNLQEFLQVFGKDISAKVIISGNGDHEFHEPPVDVPSSVKHLFLQNSFVSDNRFISTLPIGIENFRYGVNGLPWLMGPGENTVKVKKILMGPFGLTHPDRISAFELFSPENSVVDLISDRTTPKAFAQTMRSYKFVAAIRGNGVDTHRLWESLYRGVFPILKADQWSQSLEKYELPLQIIQDWTFEEMEKILATRLTQFAPSKIKSLWWPYWRRLINSYV